MRVMNLGNSIGALGAAFVAAVMMACTAEDQEALRIGTSSIGSDYYTLAVAASELIYEYGPINSAVQPVGGSFPNIFALDTNRIDLAIANAFAAYAGFHGLHPFSEPAEIRVVIQGQVTHRHFLVRKGSGIGSPMDFVGKTIIGERPSNPDMRMIMDRLIATYGLPADSIDIVSTTNTSEALKALRVGSVDAALLPFTAGNALVGQAIYDEIVEFLYIPKNRRDEMLDGLPVSIHGSKIEKETFAKQEQDIHTFSINTLLVARATVSEETVYKVTQALLDHNDELAAYVSSARAWTAERSLHGFTLPFHDGAVRYFEERGLWTRTLETKQRSLLDRTSEVFR